MAVDRFYGFDVEITDHGGHAEAGGWGAHIRLDEVLELIFPREHRLRMSVMGPGQDLLWPKEPGYEHNESEGKKVSFVFAKKHYLGSIG
jgi:hypothetical protein